MWVGLSFSYREGSLIEPGELQFPHFHKPVK
jgi:hypothetical protein